MQHPFFVNVQVEDIAEIRVWRLLKARKKDGKGKPPKPVTIDFDGWDIPTFGEVQVRDTLGGAGDGKTARYRVQAHNKAGQCIAQDVIRVQGPKRPVPVSKTHLAQYGLEPGTETPAGWVFIRGLTAELQFAFVSQQQALTYFRGAHASLEASVIALLQRFAKQPMHDDLIAELQRERASRDKQITDLSAQLATLKEQATEQEHKALRKGGAWSRLGEALADRAPAALDGIGKRLEKLADELEGDIKTIVKTNVGSSDGSNGAS